MGSSASPQPWFERTGIRLESTDPYLRMHGVNVFVTSLERSRKFYTEQLGFAQLFEANLPNGERWAAMATPDGPSVVTLVEPSAHSADREYIGRPRLIAFVTDNVLAKYEEWSGRGVQFEGPPTPQSWGGVSARFTDSDGNGFVLASHDQFIRAIELERRTRAERLDAERRLAQELEIAKQVQARLFPQILPPLTTLEYAGLCVQARQVGGDYYDFLTLGPGRLGFVIGDISGKGIAAALLMANLQANLRSQSALALDHSQQLLRSVNQLFCENTGDNVFASLFFAVYDDQTRRLRFANCGHLPALLLRADGELEKLRSTALVLGIFRDWDCVLSEEQLHPGDTLVLYTDGVTECFNAAEEEYGEERLVDALRRHQKQNPKAMLDSVIGELEAFSAPEQHDDITLIVARSH